MAIKLLYVCLGNICRSAAAEGITLKLIKDIYSDEDIIVDSAGTYGGHKGELPDKRMRQVGLSRGYDFVSISRQITKQDIDYFDVIVVMDSSNYDNVIKLSSYDNRVKIRKMSDFCINNEIDDVPDPYYDGNDGFEYVMDILEDGCFNLLKILFSNKLK